MPSAYTARNRLTKQATGENVNTWGLVLNSGAFDLIDAMADGITTISASGATSLTTANGVADQARARILNVTAVAAATITIPSVEKLYIVRAATADVTITNGSSSATVKAGDIATVITDGTTVWRAVATDFAGRRVRAVGTPVENTDAANKLYVDSTAFSSVLPGVAGQAGKFISTDGVDAFWEAITAAVIEAALGFMPASADAMPDPATGADLQALASTDKYVAPAAVKDAVTPVTLDIAAPDLSKPVQIITLSASGALGAPINVTPGTTGCFIIKQPASGGPYTWTPNSVWKPFGSTPALSTAANTADLMTWIAEATNKVRYTLQKGGAA